MIIAYGAVEHQFDKGNYTKVLNTDTGRVYKMAYHRARACASNMEDGNNRIINFNFLCEPLDFGYIASLGMVYFKGYLFKFATNSIYLWDIKHDLVEIRINGFDLVFSEGGSAVSREGITCVGELLDSIGTLKRMLTIY